MMRWMRKKLNASRAKPTTDIPGILVTSRKVLINPNTSNLHHHHITSTIFPNILDVPFATLARLSIISIASASMVHPTKIQYRRLNLVTKLLLIISSCMKVNTLSMMTSVL